jgi:tetratricopeptide (TPR) repeat protein
MVTREGKVRVMDFGLARTMERITGESTPSGDEVADTDGPTLPSMRAAEPRLTNEGNVVGTPAYMPPEQYLGVTDERSDQFSFCVSLYECLYGQHPFEARTSVGLTSNMQGGRVHDAPAGTKVPLWVRKILLKGLKPRPEDRWTSMPELLEALRKDPAVARRRWLIAGGALAAAGALIFGMQRAADSRRAFCAAGPDKVSAAWELPPRRGSPEGTRHSAVAKAFLATRKPYARDAIRGVYQLLDDYAQKWVQLYRDACEATHVRGEQSEELLDLRMSCLSDRLSEMRALTEVFSTATDEVIEHGVEAAHALSPLEGCNDIKQLRSLIPPPDLAIKTRVEQLRRELGQIKAVHDSGKYLAALEQLKPLANEARELRYRPLEGEVLARMGAASVELGRNAEAETILSDALRTAIAARHDDLLPDISANLIWVSGALGKFSEAEQWMTFADATIERLGGENSVVYSWVLNNMGVVKYLQGRFEESLEYQRRAQTVKEKALGPDDPDVAISIGNVASALNALGRPQEALELSDRSLRIRRRSEGESHPTVAEELSNRGEILATLGRPEEALGAYRHALDIWTGDLGPDSLHVGFALTGIGKSLVSLGRYHEAVDDLERALTIRKQRDPDIHRLGETEFALATAIWNDHRSPHEAVELARHALEHYGSAPGTEKARANIVAWLTERHARSAAADQHAGRTSE